MNAIPTNTFKLVLIGSAGVGKSAFVKHYRTGEFEKRYIPTVGFEVFPVVFQTSRGRLDLEIWDLAGNAEFTSDQEKHLTGADCAIVMFDLTKRDSFTSVPQQIETLRRLCPNIPITICGNKVDIDPKTHVVEASEKSSLHKVYGIEYHDFSVKSNYNLVKPFLILIRRLFNDDSIVFAAPRRA